jgi:hypothetical protein
MNFFVVCIVGEVKEGSPLRLFEVGDCPLYKLCAAYSLTYNCFALSEPTLLFIDMLDGGLESSLADLEIGVLSR